MQAINYLVPIITLPYLTRTLGSDQYGVLSLSMSIIQYGILFINFGFNLSATKKISQNRSNEKYISNVFWETILSKIILFTTCLVALTLITQTESISNIKIIIFIFYIQLFAVAIDPIWLFQGKESLGKISIIGSIIRLLNIPLLLFFVHSENDIKTVALIQALLFLLSSFINLILVYKSKTIKKIIPKEINILKSLKSSFPIFIGTAAISLYNTSTPIVLGLFSSYSEVGIYSASFRIQSACVGIFTVLGQVIYPRVSKIFSENENEGYLFIKKLLKISTPLLIITSITFYFIVPQLSPWLLGEEFSSSEKTLKILSPLITLIPISVILAHGILLPLGHTKPYFLIPTFIGLLHISYAIYLSKNYGAVGASYSILITESLSLILLILAVITSTEFIKNKTQNSQ